MSHQYPLKLRRLKSSQAPAQASRMKTSMAELQDAHQTLVRQTLLAIFQCRFLFLPVVHVSENLFLPISQEGLQKPHRWRTHSPTAHRLAVLQLLADLAL